MNDLLRTLQGWQGASQNIPNMSMGSSDYLSQVNTGYINPSAVSSAAAIPAMSGWDNLTSSFFKSKDAASGLTTGGWGEAGMGILQGLGNGWMGMQNLKLAKDTLAANKEQFALNYGAQKQTTNTALEDRQRARVATGGNYQSVGDYMNKNRIV